MRFFLLLPVYYSPLVLLTFLWSPMTTTTWAQTCPLLSFTSSSGTNVVQNGQSYSIWWYAKNLGTSPVSDTVAIMTFPAGITILDVISSTSPFVSPPVVTTLPNSFTQVGR